MLGRFDFAWDGKNPPKLLEYNADTPSLLLESSKVSQDWLEDKKATSRRRLQTQEGKFVKDPNIKYETIDRDSWQSNYIQKALENAAQKFTDECYEGPFRRDKYIGDRRNGPQIGVLTVDYDDESDIQMDNLLKIFNRYRSDTFMERISDLRMDYEIAGDFGAEQCYPVWRLQNKKFRCLLN